ncbi:3-ketoacyl-CoA thiolase [Microbotryum lychnidis-dioicae p1A1 Lamole]|uniref:3-ketoacyl-CoA thiolase n=1 Tax=Microbotryum lychnidis-dioicae (strain p1A1 Lamole / MvSl-1064) TaxID=683840 RepID=U5H4B8_USTV1|nr:3-ketoacyl-CoA thiolase [Microbotryum lychnidis-dioicae p1A1 Lamole]|eukprot:KDE07487.1 3-ketoacyl-CoA thiolase [Microbotryum lychnidis-dioicae p1A1 Lamole]
MSSPAVYIAAGRRTAFGAFGGKLKSYTAAQLGGIAGKAALADLPEGTKVDSVHFGAVLQSDPSGPYLARHVGHLSGLPVDVPACTVNRLCGSGFQVIINAAQEIKLGEADVVLTGGAESMSLAPYTLSGASRWGTRYGVDLKLEDSLAAALTDRVPNPTPMGVTAENLSDKYGITREECDAYALQSQQRWKAALDAGAFKNEITPISLPSRKKGAPSEEFTQDEHARPQSTLESLAKLPSVFKKGGTVTAGNASGICDGAAANVVVSETALGKYGIKPLARVLATHVVAVEPTIMGIGPVEAVRGALAKAGLKIEDIDLFDINEAFAAQWLSLQRELGLPNDKSNVFGGAIALGHPLAASGARIVNNLVHNLHRLDKKYAVGGACIGGGQGIAIVLERV